jgi:AraC-like DNA-binding protein
MLHRMRPSRDLAPFVEQLWCSETGSDGSVDAARERTLPTGCASLVFRLSEEPVRLFEGLDDRVGTSFGHAVVGGARSAAYVRDVARPAVSVGVQFRPGGAAMLLGVPGDELAERHVRLDDLWGGVAGEARERLLDAGEPQARIEVLQRVLLECARLERRRSDAELHPAVRTMLARIEAEPGVPIAVAVAETGLSTRRASELFRRAVGLPPKVFARVRRLQRVLGRVAARPRLGWAHIAHATGYHDQPHLVREFRAIAGFAPGSYAPVAADRPNHVPVVERARPSDPYKTPLRAGA